MKYRGYTARIDFEDQDNIFTGQLLGMSERIVFHGASVEELRADFEFAVDHYLQECMRSGKKPEKPAAGRVLLRLPPELHAAALVASAADGKSLNQWLVDAVARAAP
jgi:predicted HicB family RNase H-like nuclease